jgi:hypothetical protein
MASVMSVVRILQNLGSAFIVLQQANDFAKTLSQKIVGFLLSTPGEL